MSSSPPSPALPRAFTVGRWSLLLWLGSGLALEAFHLFKSPLFLADTLRREMWVLAHAHGGLLAVVALVVAAAMAPRLVVDAPTARRVDLLVSVGTVLVPLGFLLGGLWHGEADPGFGIFLTPVGALAWVAALWSLARAPQR